MAIPSAFTPLTGSWSGTNRLWLDPDAPPVESPTTLSASTTAQGKFLTLTYTWAHEGSPHDGLLVVGQIPEGGAVQMWWVDSFHMGDKYITFEGGMTADGGVSAKGTYVIEGYEPWGWQITVLPPAGDSFTLKMDNISPNGTHYPAVEAVYTRQH